jgi:Zn-dependent protease
LLLSRDATLESLIVAIIVVLVGMTVHEFAHNYVAWRMGDPVPAREGRLTLNPLVHIHWLGFIMFVIIGFGILGSAPISPYRMPLENRRWRWLAAVAAGPFSNLLLAVIFAIIWRLAGPALFDLDSSFINRFIYIMVLFNVLMFIFNLLPVFPLDGWNVVLSLLPPDLATVWQRHQQTTFYIFFGLILLSFVNIPGLPDPLGIIIGAPLNAIVNALLG